MSHVAVAGNVTKDAELKYTADGTPILAFSVADNMGWGDKKHTVFYNCSQFGKRGESIAPYILKGTAVTVFGELDRRDWESNGKSGVSLDIRVNDIKLQGGKNQGSAAPAAPKGSNSGFRDKPSTQADFADDDVPF